ncbi:hypothetical protein CUR178_08513 [Leishmania enriettii]|uniref:Uncharacterized protein n=1 Tax=Leishmania enriettii TaxID=5663 RepID=A0A836HJM0_LEIEN|nr:hypothetical protein CUR178_08513 [Leishmania enriettii]
MFVAINVFRCGSARPDRAMCELKISAFVKESVRQPRPSACVSHSSFLPSLPAVAAANNRDRDDAPAKEHNAVDDRGTERRRDKWDDRSLNPEDMEQDLDAFQLKAIMRLPDPYRPPGGTGVLGGRTAGSRGRWCGGFWCSSAAPAAAPSRQRRVHVTGCRLPALILR